VGEGTTLVVPQVLQYSRRLQPPTAVIKLPRLLFICLESLAQEVATPPHPPVQRPPGLKLGCSLASRLSV
jgi:hypothetical protein